MKNLSIIHIEDEFEEFESFVAHAAFWLEEYWEDQGNDCVTAKTRRLDTCKEPVANWVVYQISTAIEPSHLVNYIFIRDKEIPEEVIKHFFDDKAFILDVLRPKPGQTKLSASVVESLDSIDKYLMKVDGETDFGNVVMFTAHQGSDLDGLARALPRKISKASAFELEEFLATILFKAVADG